MIVMDSSGWVEMFTSRPRWEEFARRRDEADGVIVPTVVLYEVYKIMCREMPAALAREMAGELRSHHLVPLDADLAIDAAEYSLTHRLPMADAIVYATAQALGATLVTGDVHFDGLPGVEYIAAPGT
jgi:predicted nucleic acid-binding protein